MGSHVSVLHRNIGRNLVRNRRRRRRRVPAERGGAQGGQGVQGEERRLGQGSGMVGRAGAETVGPHLRVRRPGDRDLGIGRNGWDLVGVRGRQMARTKLRRVQLRDVELVHGQSLLFQKRRRRRSERRLEPLLLHSVTVSSFFTLTHFLFFFFFFFFFVYSTSLYKFYEKMLNNFW